MTISKTAIAKYAAQFNCDMVHPRKVASLAVSLFDMTSELHGLGKNEKSLIAAAALLHDIGWQYGQKKHHKNTQEMILRNPPEGVAHREVMIISNVARYHRKALPKLSHDSYAALNLHDREIVRRLSALLRIADGLDRTHLSRVDVAECEVVDGTLRIGLKAQGDSAEELMAAEKKSDLCEEVFGVKVKFEIVNFTKGDIQ